MKLCWKLNFSFRGRFTYVRRPCQGHSRFHAECCNCGHGKRTYLRISACCRCYCLIGSRFRWGDIQLPPKNVSIFCAAILKTTCGKWALWLRRSRNMLAELACVQVGKQYFRQKTGIPQGSKVSTLLCTMFYSYLENEHLSWTRREGSVRL